MLFHKKEKAPEGQQAGTKPEKPRKVRWSERREPSEAGLERFQDYLQTYSTNKDHPIKILCSFYKGKQKKLVETGFFLILQRSPIWIIPIATSNIINAATNPDAGSLEIILLNVMVALLFIMQNAGTNYLATVAFASVNRGIEGSLRNAMVRKLQQLSIMFHKEVQSGRLQSKIMRDVENVTELLNQIFRTLFFFVLDISVIIVITLRKSPMVFLFFLVVVPFAVLTMRTFKKPVREKNQEFRSEMENTQGAVAEMLEMIPVARAHGLQEVEISKMNTYLNRIVDRGYNLDLINALFGAVNWVVFQSFQMICLAFTAYLAVKGKISVGEVVLYQTYFTSLVGQISTLINIYPQISKGLESVKSIGDIMGNSHVEENNSIVPLGELKGAVKFVNVDFKYPGSDKNTLSDFTLDVKPGESIALVGESGAGKSTVLNLLIGFIPPVSGKILIDGHDISKVTLHSLRSQMGIMLQDSFIFSGTIMDNIRYGNFSATDEEVIRAAKTVCAHDFIMEMENGYQTQVNERGSRLSAGQRQLISFARALLADPKILILDEATSSIDTETEIILQKGLNELLKGRTSFIIAHRLSTIKNSSCIMYVDKGTILEKGTHDELMAQKGEYYKLYMSQYASLM